MIVALSRSFIKSAKIAQATIMRSNKISIIF
jgi:hypothetical protein